MHKINLRYKNKNQFTYMNVFSHFVKMIKEKATSGSLGKLNSATKKKPFHCLFLGCSKPIQSWPNNFAALSREDNPPTLPRPLKSFPLSLAAIIIM